MGSYIIRRLLLMVPTLVGISFLVFMLVALSPGGVSAVLQADAGGVQGTANNAVLRAYLEDRYGLDDAVPRQYLRWLSRISPLKFGERDQIAPNGETIRAPRPAKEPPLWQWFVAELPRSESDTPAPPQAEHPQDKIAAYRSVASRYGLARARSVAASAELRQDLAAYALALGRNEAVLPDGNPRIDRLKVAGPARESPAWKSLEPLGHRAIEAYGDEVRARTEVVSALAAGPFPKSGVSLIPDTLSLASPDFGVAYSNGRPVATMIRETLPVTLLLNLIAISIIYAIAIPSGILAAVRRGSLLDRGLGLFFIALWSVPIVLASVAAMGFLAGPEYLGVFPISGLHDQAAESMRFLPSWDGRGAFQPGYLLDLVWHVCLPVLCLVYGGFAVLSRQTRAAMLDNLSADYARTARAKGVRERDVVVRHVFRNSLLPLITMFVTVFPALLSGSVVVERVFSVPGMGSLVMQAISLRDRELLLATTMLIATVNLLALLLADILYAAADPRVSYR